jgi:hypothetical protein
MLEQLILRDQINARPPVQALIVRWQDGVPLTPRALISERVRIEWETREQERDTVAHDLPAPLVEALRCRANRQTQGTQLITLDAATAVALDGFTRNAFFLVVDGRQATDLDEVIPLRPTSQVTFVRLVSLTGG